MSIQRAVNALPGPQPTAPAYATAGSVLAGLVLWALSTYVFHGNAPGAIQAACWFVVPGLVGFVSSVLTRKYASPPEPANPAPEPAEAPKAAA